MKTPTLVLLTLIAQTSLAFASRNAGTEMAAVFEEVAPPGMGRSAIVDAAFKPVDWAQPPLGCVEDMVPHRASRPCPDLSAVESPMKDWPANMSAEDKAYWWGQRRAINICRVDEVFRREKANPGSQQKSHLELGWMAMDSLRNTEVKVQAVYDGARESGVPLQVLTGALYQESLFSELGIADDGGNFSCGMQQINLIGWCAYMNKLSVQDRTAMGWPEHQVACNDTRYIQLSLFRPIYEIAKTRLNGLPEYRLRKEHFQNIPLESFVAKWPAASREMQEYRYKLIKSYINNCSDPRRGILAKANELAQIYNQFVPSSLKNRDRYAAGEHFNRSCRETQRDNAYPLHTGWLLAVAAYNAGPRAIDAAAYYNRWNRDQLNDPQTVRGFQPTDIVTSLYWAGKYNPQNDQIEFMGLNGTLKNWTWFKGCVAQRHIARVMQHVTLLPEFFVDTLENGVACARSTFDAAGQLVKTAVPAERQKSSGRKPVDADPVSGMTSEGLDLSNVLRW